MESPFVHSCLAQTPAPSTTITTTKLLSPASASSTSTVDQQEIMIDHQEQHTLKIQLQHQQHQQQQQLQQHLQKQQLQNNRQQQQQQQQNTANTTNNATATNSSLASSPAMSKTKGPGTGPKKKGKTRPRLTSSTNSITPWKSLQHHFMRHSDVKQRPDKKQTMSELSNEGLQRRNGWKVHHLAGQIDDLIDNELQVRDRLNQLLNLFETQAAKLVYELGEQCQKDDTPHADAFALLRRQRSYGRNEFNSNLIVDKLDDLIKGHLQRSTLFTDQMLDCKDVIMRISNEHRERVVRIISKSLNKRSYVFK